MRVNSVSSAYINTSKNDPQCAFKVLANSSLYKITCPLRKYMLYRFFECLYQNINTPNSNTASLKRNTRGFLKQFGENTEELTNAIYTLFTQEVRTNRFLYFFNTVSTGYSQIIVPFMNNLKPSYISTKPFDINTPFANCNINRLVNGDARSIDFTNLNICGADLSEVVLSRQQVIDICAYARKQKYTAPLAGVDLSKVDLRGADLSEVVLSRQQVIDICAYARKQRYTAPLSKVDLRGVDLRGVDLRGANLIAAILWYTNLVGANLKYANLKDANLLSANLNDTILKNADLSGADLREVVLSRQQVIDICAYARKQRYTAPLAGVDLSGVDLAGVDLAGADLSEANLSGADLSEANLSGANLLWIQLNEANLDDIIIFDDVPMLRFNSYANLDLIFNHINNYNDSVLIRIEDIDDKYAEFKTRLMREAIVYLSAQPDQDIKLLYKAIINVIMINPIYFEDQVISDFIFNKLVYPIMENGLHHSVKLSPNEIKIFIQHINGLSQLDKIKFMVEKNLFFVQILYQALMLPDDDLKALAIKIASIYSEIPNIKSCLQALSLRGIYDPATIECQEQINIIMIVQQPDALSGISCVMCNGNYFAKYLYNVNDSTTRWSNLCYFKIHEGIATPLCAMEAQFLNLENVFTQLKIFRNKYIYDQNQKQFKEFLKSLNLGEYLCYFIQAASTKRFAMKLVQEPHQNNLYQIFSRFFTINKMLKDNHTSIELTKEHMTCIYNVFAYTGKSDPEKAQLLLCLSELFVRYSSSHVFGTDSDSPAALRYYAYALLKKAHELDSQILPANMIVDLTGRLFGLNGAFTCTAVLSDMIECITRNFIIRSCVIPAIWE